jgi:energy-converting hydrogenase Eha subunit G
MRLVQVLDYNLFSGVRYPVLRTTPAALLLNIINPGQFFTGKLIGKLIGIFIVLLASQW